MFGVSITGSCSTYAPPCLINMGLRKSVLLRTQTDTLNPQLEGGQTTSLAASIRGRETITRASHTGSALSVLAKQRLFLLWCQTQGLSVLRIAR